jgi:hypothetical protein
MTTAERISEYLLTGWNHTTPEGRAAIQAIVDDAFAESTAQIARLCAALKPLEVAGEGSSPEFAPFFEQAARSPVYWTERYSLLRDEVRSALLDIERERKNALCNWPYGIKESGDAHAIVKDNLRVAIERAQALVT